jgi:2-oxoglutarate ferredoxin oxidoreductase subunit alpha
VVIEGQRPGPAIGLPTRQEQGDLEFVLHASHGEFPRVVLAPSTVEECFWAVEKAFNLADIYQLPVIVMTDHHLATSYNTVPRFDLTRIDIDRGSLFTGVAGNYKRHVFTENGVSPRAFPGKSDALVITDSDEHDETGHLTEDPLIRSKMMNKRLGKLVAVSDAIKPPKIYGPEQPDVMLVGWGSTYGAIREAADMLNSGGSKIAHLHLSEIWPFPKGDVKDILAECSNILVVESNATGQMANLIRRETGISTSGNILRYDGRPITPADIITSVKKEVK